MRWIDPDWDAPNPVKALSTTRIGGFSQAPCDSLNLARHVGDDSASVTRNRRALAVAASLPEEPVWLAQVHGCEIADAASAAIGCEADAMVAHGPGRVCAVMTADCLPVLLCDESASHVAAVHAGWRGLVSGVVERAVERLGSDPAALLAWLGPAIGPQAFEVGEEVRDAFLAADAGCGHAFRPSPQGRWLADIYALARRRLARAGVERVWGGDLCTFSEPERFFSYRRDGRTGRMASLIWIAR